MAFPRTIQSGTRWNSYGFTGWRRGIFRREINPMEGYPTAKNARLEQATTGRAARPPLPLFPGRAMLLAALILAAAINITARPTRAPDWQTLFDGATLHGFHLYNLGDTVPERWSADQGILRLHTREEAPGKRAKEDLVITPRPCADFEFEFDWKIDAAGNSGVFYKVTEDPKYEKPWATGLEYQLLDNGHAIDNKVPSHLAGSVYDLVAPPKDFTQPVGAWNQSRIVVRGTRIEHWLNDRLAVSVDTASTGWRQLVATSKYKDLTALMLPGPGVIVLQDHGDGICFRNLRIREIAGR